jgi:hypothetical protein
LFGEHILRTQTWHFSSCKNKGVPNIAYRSGLGLTHPYKFTLLIMKLKPTCMCWAQVNPIWFYWWPRIYIYIWTRSNLAAWNMLSLTHSTWSLHSSVTLFLHAKAKHDTRMSWIKGKEEDPRLSVSLQYAPNYTIFFMYTSGYQ